MKFTEEVYRLITLKRLLCLVLLDILLAGLLLQLVTHHLWATGALPEYGRGTVLHSLRDLAHLTQIDDSWKPMLAALRFIHDPVGVYQAVFFERNVKFQYPLTSLLPMWVMQKAGLRTTSILNWLNVFSAVAVLMTIAVCVAIAIKSADALALRKKERSRVMIGSIALLISFTFYPIMWAYSLGQIQVFLNLMFSIAFLCWISQREWASGALIGVITLVKPQYAFILLWSLLRKRWGFAVSGLACMFAGVAVSLAMFGMANNLQYLRVLQFLSRHGEVFFANQSFNGLLNRLAGTAGNVEWKSGYPPFQLSIYIATLLSSLALVIWAVPWHMRQSKKNRVLDFSLVAIVATAASPIAWAHHYGIVLPILVWQIGAFIASARLSRAQSVAFASAYILIANDFRITNLVSYPPWNVVQSYLFVGILILIALLKSELEPQSSAASLAAVNAV